MDRLCCSAQQVREIFVALRHDRPPPPAYSGAMTQPDLADLARRYLDLWERRMAASATMTPSEAVAEAATIMAGALTELEQSGKGGTKGGPATTPPAAAASGAASVDGDDNHDQLARRLTECAERFAALAARAQPGGGGADGGLEAE